MVRWVPAGELELVMQVAIAAGLGALLGLEREIRSRPAGLRTHVLVAMSAALITGLGEVMIAAYADHRGVVPDPTRLVHAIVIGIGFVGAGTIVRSGDEARVSGLTTAANLLVAAAVGIAVGMGLYFSAVCATALAMLVVAGLGALEHRLEGDD